MIVFLWNQAQYVYFVDLFPANESSMARSEISNFYMFDDTLES